MGKKSPKKSEINQSSQPNQPEFDKSLLLNDQRKLELICEQAENNGTIEVFNKVKYKQSIYEVGDYLHLFDTTNTVPYVVRLESIMRVPGQNNINAVLKVEWLLKKTDLPKKLEPMVKNLSVAEVFPSGQFDFVFIESIIRKCHVLTYSEYQFLKNAGDTIHFSRATFDPKKGSLSPQISLWHKQCYCENPVNPDLAYVQCDKCCIWIHNECVENSKQLESDIFVCRNCKNTRKQS